MPSRGASGSGEEEPDDDGADPTPLSARPAWKALSVHFLDVKDLHLRTLFADDPKRGERMTAEAAGLFVDYSKNRVTDETLKLLVRLAEESGLRARIDAMFRGEKINVTEDRAVLHVALRAPKGTSILVDGKNVVPDVHAVLDRMAAFLESGAERRAGRGTPGSGSGTSSTSGSAARTSGRSWRTRRSGTTASAP